MQTDVLCLCETAPGWKCWDSLAREQRARHKPSQTKPQRKHSALMPNGHSRRNKTSQSCFLGSAHPSLNLWVQERNLDFSPCCLLLTTEMQNMTKGGGRTHPHVVGFAHEAANVHPGHPLSKVSRPIPRLSSYLLLCFSSMRITRFAPQKSLIQSNL